MATTSVTIDPQETATISYAGPFCITETADQSPTITGEATGTFAAPAGLDIDTANGDIDPSGSTAGTYTVTYTSGGACPIMATASVTIDPQETATITYATPFCITDTTLQAPTVTGTTGGTFSAPAGLDLSLIHI